MKKSLYFSLIAFLTVIFSGAGKAQNAIADLVDFKSEGITIDLVEEIGEGKPALSGQDWELPDLPSFVRVALTARPVAESNIKIEIWLPEKNWNGRLLGTGNGGGGGGINHGSLISGLRRGFAVANTDLGTSPNAGAMVGYPKRWKDFGYRATHEMTVIAKAIIEKYYKRSPSYSYFIGCSTGGQQALSEAQRYPDDYNGIIAGAPANNRTHLHSWFLWNYQQTNRNPEDLFTSEQIKQISDTLIKENAGKDGGLPCDDFLTDPRMAKVNWGVFDTLLTGKQVDILKKIQEGPVNPVTGERIHFSFPIGSEKEWSGLEYQQNANLISEQFYPFLWTWGKNCDFLTLDFNADIHKLDSILAPILNANNPDLNAFKNNGGKLLMYTGTADPIVPFQDGILYYDEVVGKQGSVSETQTFFQYYIVPGMAHCGGGPGLSDLGQYLPPEIRLPEEDILSMLINWVEKGIVPQRMIATGFKNNTRFQRPVYPYPLFPHYEGGDASLASSYRPVLHPIGLIIK
jgi:feruloyl esterase